MDKSVLLWVINELDEERLNSICKKKKIEIAGFRSNQNVPKKLLISNLMKNKNDLIKCLKDSADISRGSKDFQNKDILEIKQLINKSEKKNMVEQIIYLLTRDDVKYNELASKIIEDIIQEDNKGEKIETKEKVADEKLKEIDILNKTIKLQKTKLAQLKKENSTLTNKNQELNEQIKSINKKYDKDEFKYKAEIVMLKKTIVELTLKNEKAEKKLCKKNNSLENNDIEEKDVNNKVIKMYENRKKILLIGSNNTDDLEIPVNLRGSIDTLKDNDINNIFDNEYINQYKKIWILTFNISTQSEYKLRKLDIEKIEFNNLQKFKVYIRKGVNL